MREKEEALAIFLRENCIKAETCNQTCNSDCEDNAVAWRRAQIFYAGWNAAMKVLRGKPLNKVVDIILKNEKDE